MPKRIEYKKWEEVGPYKHLYIEERPKKDNSNRRALFLCGRCGVRTFEAQIGHVKGGYQKSCGCAKSDYRPNRVKDLTGKKVGRLTVVEQVPHKIGEYAKWRCVCECGNETIVSSNNLTSKNPTISCGCRRMSTGELKIKIILEKLKIKYIREYEIADSRQRFDFFLPDLNIAIEYDGVQHFKSVDYFGGEEGFKKTKERDRRKDEYCQSNNIKLIRIPYTDFDKLNEDYISNLLKNS